MKLLVQWSQRTPPSWVEIDLGRGPIQRAWRDLPTRPEPASGQLGGQDDQPGWVSSVNCQGVVLEGYDHYAAEPVDAGLRVTVWNDDPADWPAGTRLAEAWTFMTPAPDVRFGGAVNTRQGLVRYLEPGVHEGLRQPCETSAGPVEIRSWTEFQPPALTATKHGIWLPDDLFSAHVSARPARGWKEWA